MEAVRALGGATRNVVVGNLNEGVTTSRAGGYFHYTSRST
jgi:hypothetical protein